MLRISHMLAFAALAVAPLFLGGCLKKYDPDKLAGGVWNPNLAVPIAYSRFDVYDILDRAEENDLVVIDPMTGLLALRYEGQAFSFSASEVLQLPDFAYSNSFSGGLDFGFPVFPSFNGQMSESVSESIDYETENGEGLYDILLAGGQLNIDVSTDLQHDVALQLEFPYITVNGAPLVIDVNLPFTGGTSSSSAQTNLTNAFIDFTDGGTTTNAIAVNITATLNGTGNPIVGTENIDVDLSLNGLSFALARGYVGQQTVALDGDSILIAIFQNSIEGYFELVNPRLQLRVMNSFGFPVALDVTQLQTVNTSNGMVYPLTGYPNPTLIGAPLLPGDSLITTLEFNSQNTSNISNIITPVPKYLHFAVEGGSNPNGEADAPNFIAANSQLRVDATLEMPLQGFAYGFVVRDTLEFTFDEDIEEVDWVMIRLYAKNGFPVDLSGQLYLADANYTLIDTLITAEQQVLQAGLTNASGKVVNPTEKTTDIFIPRERIDNLLDAAYLIFVAETNTLNGSNSQVVGIYDSNFLELRLGLQVQGRINVSSGS